MVAVSGLRGTGDWGTDERPKNFREGIMWMDPNGDSALFALSSMVKGKAKAVDDPEFSWWDEPQDIVRLQVNGALTSGDTLVTVDSSDPSSSLFKSNWGLATHLVPGDILLVEPSTDTASDTAERVIVTQVHSTTQFSVSRGASGSTAGAIADNSYLLLVGSAFAEGTAEPTAVSRNPVKFSNYTQIFKTTYEVTGTAEQTRARTGDAVANDKKRRAFDHARSIEMAMLFGQKNETVGSNGKPLRFMGGLRSFIPAANSTILTTNWGFAAGAGGILMDAISPMFDYSTPGGDTRIALCGNGALTQINKAVLGASGSAGLQVQWGMTEKIYGMNVRELLFPQGRLLLRRHPLMTRNSLYTNSMFVIDQSAIKYVPLRGRDTRPRDNIQDEGEDLRRGMWQTECSMMVAYAGQTCGYIGGFGATPA